MRIVSYLEIINNFLLIQGLFCYGSKKSIIQRLYLQGIINYKQFIIQSKSASWHQQNRSNNFYYFVNFLYIHFLFSYYFSSSFFITFLFLTDFYLTLFYPTLPFIPNISLFFIYIINILNMFGKVKDFLVQKAFGFAFARYDLDHNSALNPDQLTSLINDVFQLLRINRKVSFFEVGIIGKMLDLDGDSQISQQQCYQACRGALAKFGGIGGIATLFGKTGASSQVGGVKDKNKAPENPNYAPPQDISEQQLKSLPPPGANVVGEDVNKKNSNANQGQAIQYGWENQPTQGWGTQQNQQQWGQNQAWGQNQQQGWGQQQQYQGWNGQNQGGKGGEGGQGGFFM